jgi:hypothetical protein
MRLRPLLLALAPVLLLAAGCGAKKLNETKTLTLDKEVGARSLDLPAPKKDIKVAVDFASSDGEVTVLVFKEADAPDLIEADGGKALARKKGKADNFVADVPAGTAVRVVVRGHTAAKTDVTLKVVEQ